MNLSFSIPHLIDYATQAAYQGGDVLKKYWGNLKSIQNKSIIGDLVTEADQQAEKVIIDFLTQHFPDHQILGEESGLTSQQSDFMWVIDPLDGTTNYAHQYPHFAVSIGLLYQSQPIVGVIYQPISEECFQAGFQWGSKRNGVVIHVSNIAKLSNSLLATGFPYNRQSLTDNNYKEFCHFTHLTHGVRRAGAAALDLAYVACGRLDGYWEHGIKPWDIAAEILLVTEAGGTVSEYFKDSLDLYAEEILATNSHLHQTIKNELTKIR